MSKRLCVFTPNLKLEFPFLKDGDQVEKVFCTICKSVFSIKHGGLADTKQHTTTVKKHLLALSAASKHEKVTFYFLKINTQYIQVGPLSKIDVDDTKRDIHISYNCT